MVSRAQRRLLNELEDQKFGLGAMVEEEEEEESSSEVEAMFPTPPVAVVAPKKSKKKKKKKKPKAAVVEEEKEKEVVVPPKEKDEVPAPAIAATGAKKKSKNKNKKKNRKQKQNNMDEFDRMIEEFAPGATAAAAKETLEGRSDANASSSSAWAVNLDLLDEEQDFKRMFGVSGAKSVARKRLAGDKSRIVKRHKDWPLPRAMLRVQQLGQLADDGATVYGFVWSDLYKQAEEEFVRCVATNQPSTFVLLIQRYGFHSGALLQLATLSVKSGQFEQAADLLERAVWFFEHCIGSSFRLNDPTIRFPYSVRENQAFFVTMFKYCSMLAKKGCTAAALECSKLMLSWDPLDPLDFLLLVDLLAIRSEHFQWLVDAMDEGAGYKNLKFYPNLAFGVAFALQALKREKQAFEALKYALCVFPECAIEIMNNLGLDVSWQKSPFFGRFGSTAPNASLQRVVTVYCTRSKDLWRPKDVHSWVCVVAGQIAAGEVDASVHDEDRTKMLEAYGDAENLATPSVLKHMMLAEEDMEAANNAIPLNLLQEELNMDALNQPPPANGEIAMARLMGSDANVPTLEEQVESLRRAPTANALALFLHSLMPWNDPNAPPPEDDEQDRAGLLAQAQAILGLENLAGERQRGNEHIANDDEVAEVLDFDSPDEDVSSHTDSE